MSKNGYLVLDKPSAYESISYDDINTETKNEGN